MDYRVVITPYKEKWIDGFEGYYKISNTGYVISHIKSAGNGRDKRDKPIKLKPIIDKDGYRSVTLCRDGYKKNHRVHRLVAEAFIPNPDNKPHVNHLDSDPSNNNVRNLEWVTPSENKYHAYKHGNKEQYIGEEHHNSKLTESDVLWIRDYYKRGEYNQSELADLFDTCQQYISKIVLRKVWKHI